MYLPSLWRLNAKDLVRAVLFELRWCNENKENTCVAMLTELYFKGITLVDVLSSGSEIILDIWIIKKKESLWRSYVFSILTKCHLSQTICSRGEECPCSSICQPENQLYSRNKHSGKEIHFVTPPKCTWKLKKPMPIRIRIPCFLKCLFLTKFHLKFNIFSINLNRSCNIQACELYIFHWFING